MVLPDIPLQAHPDAHGRRFVMFGNNSSKLLIVHSSVLAIGTCAAFAAPPRFKASVLEPLPGGIHTTAMAINDDGVAVGLSSVDGSTYPHAAAWIDGRTINLTGLGFSGAVANDIGPNGLIVGISDEFSLRAFSWLNGELNPLAFPHQCCSEARGVNAAGQIVGNASLGGINTPNDGVMWDNGVIVPLGSLGGSLAHANDINDQTQIVGISAPDNSGTYLAFVWERGEMRALPTLGGTWGEAHAINNSSVIVGYAEDEPGFWRPVKWINELAIELPTLGGFSGAARDVNESGWIVGYSSVTAQPSARATLWINDAAFQLDALALLPVGSSLSFARGLNNVGQIVADGQIANEPRAAVLTPLRPGDVDGDDVVNIQDLLGVIGGWGQCLQPHAVNTCPADLNVNGTVDLDDLLQVINNWD
jgi:probable HAF family extracellular repeat protein